MTKKIIKPYGAWESSITADLIVSNSIGLGEIQILDDALYWIEMRPEEKGRYVVVEQGANGVRIDRIPEPYNARTRVHEYGGGSFLAHDELIYFSNFQDQQLYCIDRQNALKQLTHDAGSRFADFVVDQTRQHIISVMETHHPDSEPRNTLVAIDLEDELQIPKIIHHGSDFYSNPRISPDGNQFVWISWDHPNMPWDDSELWLAELNERGDVLAPRLISGGNNESVFQPMWSPNGTLFFISDKNGWWNLYRYRHDKIEIVIDMAAEFGVPQWSFRESTYDFIDDDTIVCTYVKQGFSHFAKIDVTTRSISTIQLDYTDIESVQANATHAAFLAASVTRFPELVRLDLQDNTLTVLRQSSQCDIESDCISKARAIEFPTQDNLTAHAFYYPPNNPRFTASEEELPPLIVFSHGGPTGMSRSGLKMVIQYFTSRGLAVVDVNYGGSSGYGRDYRQRLNGLWGIVDVADCHHAALYLADEKRVDLQRLAIRGGSAGGYTTLAALTFLDVFKAGCSRYGVSDLEALAKETHKFESRYLDNLIGPYPEAQEVYRKRSPIHATDKLSCPVIFFQGMDDKIVLPNQAEMMVDALKKKGLPVAYVPFDDEQHGFRQASNIKHALEGELFFYSRVFDFDPAGKLAQVDILNMD